MVADAQPADDLRDLYRELILDHARNPRHFGKLENASHQAEGINPLCGDKLRLYLTVDAEHIISDIKFEGSGCAISIASASLLTETISGVSCAKAVEYFDDVVKLLSGESSAETQLELGKLKSLAGVSEYPARVKCATLAWHALNTAITSQNSNETQPVSTE